jgi:amidohydrolase
MAIVAGLALQLQQNRPASGSVVLLFQPSEETGEGARRVLDDPQFEQIVPDHVFALHNLPGFPLGQVIVRDGVFASASTGFKASLTGHTSHAAEPEAGNSPAIAIAELIHGISSLPQFRTSLHEAAQATVIHARLGKAAFGTSPGEGEVMATLRSHTADVMDRLSAEAGSLAEGIAGAHGLKVATSCTEVFPSTVNNADSVAVVSAVANELGFDVRHQEIPFAWSEDFGHFTSQYKGALFGLGSGEDHPVLHHPDYDFPDDLIEPGVELFMGIIHQLLD